MLVFLPDYFWVVADEPDIRIIQRSPDALRLGDGPPDLPPIQAFVVVIGIKGEERVFVALHAKSLKRNLVYELPTAPGNVPNVEALCKEAKAFLARCHFTLSNINLNLRTAMREVVIRDIPAVLDTKSAAKADKKRQEDLAEWRRLVAEAQQDEGGENDDAAGKGRRPNENQLERRTAQKKLAAEEAAQAQLTQLRKVFENLALPGAASKEPAPGTEEIDAGPPDSDLDQARQEVARLAAASDQANQLEEHERAIREQLAAEKATLEQQAGKLAAAARAAEAKAKADHAEMEKLLARQAEAERQAQKAAARAEEAQRSQQVASADRERLVQAMREKERLATEMTEAAREAELRAKEERAEREALEAAKRGAETQAEELARVVREIEARLASEREERERLAREKAEAEERLQELAQLHRQASDQANTLQAEREQREAEKAEREQLAAAKTRLEQRTEHLAKIAREATARAEQERAEREKLLSERATYAQLVEEKAALEVRAAQLAEEARQAAEQAETERAERQKMFSEQTTYARLVEEKAALEARAAQLAKEARQAAEQAETERAERQKLAAEKTEREKLTAEKAELERRAAQLAEEARASARQAEQERSERERLEAEKKLVEERLKTMDTKQPEPSPPPKKETPPPPPPSPPIRRPPVPGAFFNVDWDLEAVPGNPLREVIEVQRSMTMSHLSLEGFPNQYCGVYVLGLKRKSAFSVNIVFRLMDSQRLLIYVPGPCLPNQQAYRRALQEARKFLQTVGIETDRLPLPPAPQSRAQILATIPIFAVPVVAG